MTDFLQITRDGPIVTWTMNHPATRNALTGNTAVAEIVAAAGAAGADRTVRAIILTGAGPVFSSGGNVKDMARFAEPGIDADAIRNDPAKYQALLASESVWNPDGTFKEDRVLVRRSPQAASLEDLRKARDGVAGQLANETSPLTPLVQALGLDGVTVRPTLNRILDILDGALARAGGKGTPFGAFLDSSLDRVGEAAMLGAIGLVLALGIGYGAWMRFQEPVGSTAASPSSPPPPPSGGAAACSSTASSARAW